MLGRMQAVVAQRAEAPIKVVHIWLAVIVMALSFMGGMLVSVFKVGQWNGAVTARMDRQLEVTQQLVEQIKRVAQQSQESHEFILQHKSDIEALRKPQAAPTPSFNEWPSLRRRP